MQSEGLGDRQNSVFNISSLNPRFRKYRKQLHSGLNSRATQTYFPLINQERLVFLNGLATAPQDFISHTRRYISFKISLLYLLTLSPVMPALSFSKLPMGGRSPQTMTNLSNVCKKQLILVQRSCGLEDGLLRSSRFYALFHLGCQGRDSNAQPFPQDSVCVKLIHFPSIGPRSKLSDGVLPLHLF
jgi:hypothetical protein